MSDVEKKILFENFYTPFIDVEDVEFLYELLSVFYDYNNGLIDDAEELEVMNYVIQELEFIRSIPVQLQDEGEDIESMNAEELFDSVRETVEMTIESSFKEGEENVLMDGLSARIALGLGMVYDNEEWDEEDLIQMEYDEEEDDVILTNLSVPGEDEE